MSDQVRLSAYTETVRNLIHSNRYDEAIAVCQHILSCYPKNIVTYRQMAEAYLEKGNLQDAAELFRRVLSADPEDDIAYIGLAAIFEQQALIDEAVWHLERAFELKPGSLEIRNELLRLYGERDGRPPDRLRLTPGALGRLYVREGLFNHAIQEFRSVLAESPRRLDARLALAESLWRAGQVREASEISQELVQTLPYCLKANLILGIISQESEGNESETYWLTAQDLDPTNRVAQELLGEQLPFPTAEALVPQFVPGAALTPQPLEQAATAAEVEATETRQGFEEWFGEGSLDAEFSSASAPVESPYEGEAAAEPDASFDERTAQVEASPQPVVQEEPVTPEWVTEVGVPSDRAKMPAAEQPLLAETEIEQPAPQPEAEPELPAELLDDSERAPEAEPLLPPGPYGEIESAPEDTLSSDSSLPSWLAGFRETPQAGIAGEPAIQAPAPEISLEPGPESSAEPVDLEEMPPSAPVAEEEATPAETLPSWINVPPFVAEESDLTQAPTGQMPPEEAAAEPEASAPLPPAAPSASEAQARPTETEEQTLEQFEEWFEETKAHVAAEAAATPTTTEKRPTEETPDWLKGLELQAAPETPSAVEDTQVPETASQPALPPAGAQVESAPAEGPAPLALPHEPTEEIQTIGEGAPVEGTMVEAEAQTEPVEVEPPEVETVQPQPQSESGTVTLSEEEVDEALYGEGAPGLETQELPEEPAGGETEPIQAATSVLAEVETEPEIAELGAGSATESATEYAAESATGSATESATEFETESAAESATESRAAELVRSRRDPKGYAHLERARAHLQENRLGEALKEYDYLVQHSPRLISAVIEDMERLIREWEVPLEAHRILGDAYTRVDRLAQALECYRFVLQRVS